MSDIASLADVRALLADLPAADEGAAAAIAKRQARLTKPQGSLGRLEELVAWLGRWQARDTPSLDHVSVLVFAGNHGVVARGVSAYPASVTAQMVANFEAGGAAINQICKSVGASLRVIPLNLDTPTRDFTESRAMSEGEFVEALEGFFSSGRLFHPVAGFGQPLGNHLSKCGLIVDQQQVLERGVRHAGDRRF